MKANRTLSVTTANPGTLGRGGPLVSLQRGASMIEFSIAAVLLTIMGLSIVQFALLFLAKNTLNYAAFEAARAGAFNHANATSIQSRFATALAPLYGGGTTPAQLALAVGRAKADVAAFSRVQLINPTVESFNDWADPALASPVGKGSRTIPNAALHLRANAKEVRSASGQNLYDANVLKIRIVYGYEPRIPIARQLLLGAWNLMAPPTGAEGVAVASGRIPIVVEATMRMASEPVESSSVQTLASLDAAALAAAPGGHGGLNPQPHPPNEGSPNPAPGNGDPGPVDIPDDPAVPGEPSSPDIGEPPTESRPCLFTNPALCRPPGCKAGDPSCDPACRTVCCPVP